MKRHELLRHLARHIMIMVTMTMMMRRRCFVWLDMGSNILVIYRVMLSVKKTKTTALLCDIKLSQTFVPFVPMLCSSTTKSRSYYTILVSCGTLFGRLWRCNLVHNVLWHHDVKKTYMVALKLICLDDIEISFLCLCVGFFFNHFITTDVWFHLIYTPGYVLAFFTLF